MEGDHRSHAIMGKEFEDEIMLDVPIDDVGLTDAVFHRFYD